MERCDFGRRINHRVVFLKDYPDAQAKTERRYRPVASDLDGLIAETVRIQEDFGLNDLGRQRAFAALDEKALALASRIEAIAKDVLQERVEMVRNEERAARGEPRLDPAFDTPQAQAILALLRPKAPAGEAPEVVARRHEEVRGLARQLEPGQVRDRYLQALRDGTDPEFVAAVEGAPASFPVLDNLTRAIGREFKVQRSPQAESINEARAFYDVNMFLIESAWAELYNMFPLTQLRDRRPVVPPLERLPSLPFGLTGSVVNKAS